jgi:hypothetical protein
MEYASRIGAIEKQLLHQLAKDARSPVPVGMFGMALSDPTRLASYDRTTLIKARLAWLEHIRSHLPQPQAEQLIAASLVYYRLLYAAAEPPMIDAWMEYGEQRFIDTGRILEQQ